MSLSCNEALKLLISCADELKLQHNDGNCTEKEANLIVEKNGVEINTWYSGSSQLFGFNMINGGHKTYDSIDTFREYFANYVEIYTVFLPNAKSVSDVFEKELDLTSVYDTFMGNKEQGYVAQFKVLGSEDIIRVSKIPDGFSAVLITDNKGKKVIPVEYHYEVTEDNNVIKLPTIHSYLNEVMKRYENNNNISLKRIGMYDFKFSIEDLVISATVSFVYTSINYLITKISGVDCNETISLDDGFDLSELYLKCKEIYNNNSFEEEETIVEDATPISDESATSIQDEEFSDEEVDENNEVSETVEEIMDETNLTVKVLKNNNVIESVVFVLSDNIFNMPVDVAKSLGIPVNRITDEVKFIQKGGILITEDEQRLHIFMKDITVDDEICEKLFNMLFD